MTKSNRVKHRRYSSIAATTKKDYLAPPSMKYRKKRSTPTLNRPGKNYNYRMTVIHSYCSYCGAPFQPDTLWPRTCSACGNTSFRNPLPVCVVLVPIDADGFPGVLAIRRAIPPKIGELALPGGYINYGETWQEAGAREVFEETGLRINPAEIREFRVQSAPDGTLIIFSLALARKLSDLPVFIPNEEASERMVLTQPAPMAFGLHNEMVSAFFNLPSAASMDR